MSKEALFPKIISLATCIILLNLLKPLPLHAILTVQMIKILYQETGESYVYNLT